MITHRILYSLGLNGAEKSIKTLHLSKNSNLSLQTRNRMWNPCSTFIGERVSDDLAIIGQRNTRGTARPYHTLTLSERCIGTNMHTRTNPVAFSCRGKRGGEVQQYGNRGLSKLAAVRLVNSRWGSGLESVVYLHLNNRAEASTAPRKSIQTTFNKLYFFSEIFFNDPTHDETSENQFSWKNPRTTFIIECSREK